MTCGVRRRWRSRTRSRTLSKKLQARESKERLAAGADDKPPAEYQKQVDDYFKAIAAKKRAADASGVSRCPGGWLWCSSAAIAAAAFFEYRRPLAPLTRRQRGDPGGAARAGPGRARPVSLPSRRLSSAVRPAVTRSSRSWSTCPAACASPTRRAHPGSRARRPCSKPNCCRASAGNSRRSCSAVGERLRVARSVDHRSAGRQRAAHRSVGCARERSRSLSRSATSPASCCCRTAATPVRPRATRWTRRRTSRRSSPSAWARPRDCTIAKSSA